jgi:phage gpG-like protein
MASIDVQLHTLAPAKLEKLKAKLSGKKNLETAQRLVAKQLLALTQKRFEDQTDPWGNAWIPSQRVLGQRRELEKHEKAMAAYNARLARWNAQGKGSGRGKKPVKPKAPKDRSSDLTVAGQTLVDTGRLRSSFEVVKKGDSVVLTQKDMPVPAKFKAAGAVSNLVYFPAHQWGLPQKNVPARPMLPIRGNQVELPDTYRALIRHVLDLWVKDVVA